MNKKFVFIVVLNGQRKMVQETEFKYLNSTIVNGLTPYILNGTLV